MKFGFGYPVKHLYYFSKVLMGFSSSTLCDSFKEDAVGEAVLWGKKKPPWLGSFFFLQDLSPGKWLQCVKSQ